MEQHFKEEICHYGHPLDMKKSYRLLPSDMQKHIAERAALVSPEQLAKLPVPKLIAFEEGSDMILERWEQKLVTFFSPKDIENWSNRYLKYRLDNRSFDELLHSIKEDLSREKPDAVKKFTRFSWLTPEESLGMMAMSAFKMALFHHEQHNFDPKSHVQPLLNGEADELVEKLPKHSLERRAILAFSNLYTRLPGLPNAPFQALLFLYIRHKVKQPIQFTDIKNYELFKFKNRQAVHYQSEVLYKSDSDPENKRAKAAYRLRKSHYKPFELIEEGSYLIEASMRRRKQSAQHPVQVQQSRVSG